MCGKDLDAQFDSDMKAGSPPHVRERHVAGFDADGKRGITPACAGKTAQVCGKAGDARDHPRMCGKDCLGESSL